MASKMDQSLDEILADKKPSGSRGRRGGNSRNAVPRRDRRDEYPRDGIKKSYRDDSRHLDSEWVHDRFEEANSRRSSAPRHRDSPGPSDRGTKLRVDNLHYELTEDDLQELFSRLGRVLSLSLRYDRAGRSEGVAFVTYESRDSAQQAIREFDGANAKGQPIRLTILSSGRTRNPFDSAVMPGRPLAERITAPSGRSRSHSPPRHSRYDEDDAARRGIDRYVPDRGSRSPMPGRSRPAGGRRPGARRERPARDTEAAGRSNAAGGGNRRPKKTQEELDAEMEDYFGGGGTTAPEPAHVPVTNGQADEDEDMIE